MGWLIALGVLAGFAMFPLGIGAVYDEGGLYLRLRIGPFYKLIYPRKKREKRQKKNPAPKTAAVKPKQTKSKGGNVRDFVPLLRIALDFLASLKRKIRVNRLEMRLILGGDDPCDLAVNYGRAWTAVGNLIPSLERFLVIKKRDVEVECDFTSSETRVFARLDLTITLGRLLCITLYHGFRAVREYLNILKLRKGGAKL